MLLRLSIIAIITSAFLTLVTAVPHAASTTLSVSHTPVSRPQVLHTHVSTTLSTSQTSETQYGPTPTCTQTITPDKNGYVPPNTCGALYDYYPSFGAAVAASFFFGMVTIAHIAQAYIHKKKFCWVIIMASFWELSSFITRTLGTRHQQSSGLQMISQLLVLLAPLWVNAFSYMVLARMVHFFVPSQKLLGIKASTFALTFVSLDIVSFVIQLIGGGMAGNDQPPAQQMHGIHIYMGGIGLQELSITVFVGLAIKFHLEMIKMEGVGRLVYEKQRWRRLLYTLYAGLGLITIRIIYRLSEFSGGNGPSNPLPNHESYFYIFEALPMFLAILALNITHPGTYLQGPDSELPKSRIWRKCKCCCGRKRAKKAKKAKRAPIAESRESEYDMPLCKAPAEISVAPVPVDGYWRG